jgi:ATP-dependent DNA helicase DinG
MDVAEILGSSGPFAQLIEGYTPRDAQLQMASKVAQALAKGEVLVAEAGTGTGKTFAYLVPALLSGQKVIVSTGTKNLQDQLFNKDLPLVKKALGVPVEVALLKGRANYLCPHRLELAMSGGRFQSRSEAHEIQQIRQWSGGTQSGDIAECHQVSESSMVWSQVTSTADNCLGGDCEFLSSCYLNHARRRAQEAELVVVNHHLFFADLSLRNEGVGELLPAADSFIFDEAHQLPDVAANFFGITMSGNQLLELARDTIAEDINEAGEDRRLRVTAEQLEKAVKDLRLALGESQRRAAWNEVAGEPRVIEAIAQITVELDSLYEALEPQADRGKGLASCLSRCGEFRDRLDTLTSHPPEHHIHWFETHTRSFTLNLTPLQISERFLEQMEGFPRSSWVFTSATLAVGQRFDHFTRELGIEGRATTAQWQSPFDFSQQALLYVPEGMPEPNEPDYVEAVIDCAVAVMSHNRGGTFILFTSHRALRRGAELLEGRINNPILIQGDEPRSILLEQFRKLGNAVLLGTGSFWEGVDVRGEALSCVIIDKLPFASPGDPILQARIDAMRKEGKNPFMEYQLPQAVITLKQGVGRLIRDVADFGVLVLCDPRLGSKSYGKIFIDSLPLMSKTRKQDVVERFFDHHYEQVDQ